MTNRSASEPTGVPVTRANLAAGESAAPSAAPTNAGPAPATSPAQLPNTVRVVSFEAGVLRDLEGDPALTELRRAVGSGQARVWVDVCEPAPSLLAEIGQILELHPLLAEDLAERDQRAKLDQIGELLHLVVFSLGFDGGQYFEQGLARSPASSA